MRKTFLILLLFSLISKNMMAQSRPDNNSFTFNKSENSKIDRFSFSGIGLEYYWPEFTDTETTSSIGLGLSYEAYFPVTNKTAFTSTLALRYFNLSSDEFNYEYNRVGLDLNIGYHIQLIKNYYVKPQIGLSTFTNTIDFDGFSEEESITDLTYGLQTGFIFNLKTKKPSFIDVGLSYQSFLSDEEGSFIGVYTKYMFSK